MNQFGTLVTMSVEKVGGAQTGLGEILSSAGGKGKSRSESAFQSNSGPVDGCAWSGGMAAYDGDGVGTGSDKGAAMRWGPGELVVDAEGPKLIGGPEVAGGKLLGRQFSEPVGWRDRGGSLGRIVVMDLGGHGRLVSGTKENLDVVAWSHVVLTDVPWVLCHGVASCVCALVLAP